jgi:CRISPR system Cascade subunit CasE
MSYLVRARLRRDVSAAALAPLLVPDETGARASAAHRLLWSLFTDGPDRRRDFLWRETGPGAWLALAARPPADPHHLFDLDYKPFAPALREGQRLGFSLRANPVVSGPTPEGGKRGARHDAVMRALHATPPTERAARRAAVIAEAGTAWLVRQGAANGFAHDPDRMHIDGYDQIRIPRRDAKPVQFSVLLLEGVLTVTDPAAFLARVRGGFGKARAFGCGLMLLRPAGETDEEDA